MAQLLRRQVGRLRDAVPAATNDRSSNSCSRDRAFDVESARDFLLCEKAFTRQVPAVTGGPARRSVSSEIPLTAL